MPTPAKAALSAQAAAGQQHLAAQAESHGGVVAADGKVVAPSKLKPENAQSKSLAAVKRQNPRASERLSHLPRQLRAAQAHHRYAPIPGFTPPTELSTPVRFKPRPLHLKHSSRRESKTAPVVAAISAQSRTLAPHFVAASPTSAGSIAGVITDALTGQPVPGACAIAWSDNDSSEHNGCAGADGSYVITDVPAGNYWVRFEDHVAGHTSTYYGNGDMFVMSPGEAVTGIDGHMQEGGWVAGTVTSGADHSPLGGVCISLEPVNDPEDLVAGGCTDANGHYQTSGAAPGDYHVTFEDDAGPYLSQWYPGTASGASAAAVTISLNAGTSPIDAALQRGGGISGTVSAAGGAPISGICGYVEDQATDDYAGSVRCSGSDGRFSTSGLQSGSYRVWLNDYTGTYLSGYLGGTTDAAQAAVIAVTLGEDSGGHDVTLTRAGSVSGTITDASTGLPLAGVCVSAMTADGDYVEGQREGCTDASGAYHLRGLSSGSYLLQAEDDSGSGYLPTYYGGTELASAQPVSVTLGSDTPSADMAMTLGGRISGTVTDGSAGLNAEVAVFDDSGDWAADTYASNGTFVVTGLRTGIYTVRFSATRYVDQWYDGKGSRLDATPVHVTAGDVVTGVNGVLQPGAVITGTITDAATTQPLAGVCPQLDEDQPDGFDVDCSDTNGLYHVYGLPSGTYHLGFSEDGYIFQWYANADREADAQPIDVTAGQVKSGIDVALVRGGIISGTVTEAGTGNPPSDGDVCPQAVDANGDRYGDSSCVDPDTGAYSITGLPSGSYTVQFSGGDYLDQWWQQATSEEDAHFFTVTAGQTVDSIDAAMHLGGIVTGKVTDATDAAGGLDPDSDIYAEVINADDTFSRRAYVDPDSGTYHAGGLPAGTYHVRFRDYSQHYVEIWYDDATAEAQATDVNVVAGALTPGIDQAMSVGGSISGVVADALSGQPVSGVCANVFESSDTNDALASACTDSDGSYTVGNLAPGDYVVQFIDEAGTHFDQWWNSKTDASNSDRVQVHAGEDTSNINAALALGASISGRVTDGKSGLPLTQVCVALYDQQTLDSVGSARCTDEGGYYHSAGVPAGTYLARFEDYGGSHISQWWQHATLSQDATQITLAAAEERTGVDMALSPAATLSGRVTSTGGGPVADCAVYAFDTAGNFVADACTNDDGIYTLAVPAGDYHVQFGSYGYAPQWYDGVADEADATTVSVSGSDEVSGLDAVLAPNAPPGPPTVTLAAASGNARQAIPLQATVAAASDASSPTGSVAFWVIDPSTQTRMWLLGTAALEPLPGGASRAALSTAQEQWSCNPTGVCADTNANKDLPESSAPPATSVDGGVAYQVIGEYSGDQGTVVSSPTTVTVHEAGSDPQLSLRVHDYSSGSDDGTVTQDDDLAVYAVVGAPAPAATGYITLTDNGSFLCAQPLDNWSMPEGNTARAIACSLVASAGSHHLAAHYNGDPSFHPADADTVTVVPAVPVTFNASWDPASPVAANAATLHVQLATTDGETPPPTHGCVQVDVNGSYYTDYCLYGSSSIDINFWNSPDDHGVSRPLHVGANTVTLRWQHDYWTRAYHDTAPTNVPVDIAAQPNSTTTSLEASSTSSSATAPLTLTAVVETPDTDTTWLGGLVYFYDGDPQSATSKNLGSAWTYGEGGGLYQAQLYLANGLGVGSDSQASHHLYAVYVGDADHQTSTSPPTDMSIGADNPTQITLSTSKPDGVASNGTASITATVTSNGTPVSAQRIVTLDAMNGTDHRTFQAWTDGNGVATFTLGAGPSCWSWAWDVYPSSGAYPSCSTDPLSVGTYRLVAHTDTGGGYAAGTSSELDEQVGAGAPVHVTLAADPEPSVYDSAVGYTATVTPDSAGVAPTGVMEFLDGTAVVGFSTLQPAGDGTSTATWHANAYSGGTNACTNDACGGYYTPRPRVHSLSVRYLGDGTYAAAASASYAHTVVDAHPTTTTVQVNSPVTARNTVTITVTVASTDGAGAPVDGAVNILLDGVSIGPGVHDPSAPDGVFTATVSNYNPHNYWWWWGGACYTGPSVTPCSTSEITGVGSHVFTATYTGANGYADSADASGAQLTVVEGSPTSVTVSSDKDTPHVGATFTLTAHVAPTADTVPPTGYVNFTDGTAALGVAAIDSDGNGVLELSSGLASVGDHDIKATYIGDPNNAPSTGDHVVTAIDAWTTALSLVATPGTTVARNPVTLTATVSAVDPDSAAPTSGYVDFYRLDSSNKQYLTSAGVDSSSVATAVVSTLPVGDYTIEADFVPANGTGYSGSRATTTETIQPGAASVVTVTSDQNPSAYTDAVTLTATVAAGDTAGTAVVPTGTVYFYADGNYLGAAGLDESGNAGISVSWLSTTGTATAHHITAGYLGDPTYEPSTSTTLDQQVLAVTPTSTTLAADPASPVARNPVDLTATVAARSGSSAPSGAVLFLEQHADGTLTQIGSGNLVQQAGTASSATLTVPANSPYLGEGAHTFRAIYNTQGGFGPSHSGGLKMTVQPGAPVQLDVSASPATQVIDRDITITAHLLPAAEGSPTPAGAVTFWAGPADSGQYLGAVNVAADGSAALTTRFADAADRTINAVYSGDSAYEPASGQTLLHVIAGTPTSSTLDTADLSAYLEQSVTIHDQLAADDGQTPTGIVDVYDGPAGSGAFLAAVPVDGKGVATFSGPYLGAGEHDLTVLYPTQDGFLTSTATAHVSVLPLRATDVALQAPAAADTGHAVNITATVSTHDTTTDAVTGLVTFTDATGEQTSTLGTADVQPDGTAAVSVTLSSAGQHHITAHFVHATANGFADSSSTSATVNVAAATLTGLTAVPGAATPAMYAGEPISVSVNVAEEASNAQPVQGSVQLLVDGQTVGAALPVADGVAATSLPGLSVGTHSISAEFTPANSDADTASASEPQQLTIRAIPVTLALTMSPAADVPAGTAVSASVTPEAAYAFEGAPTGTVVVSVDGQPVGDGVAVAGSDPVSVQLPSMDAGQHAIAAHYQPDQDGFVSASDATAQQILHADSTVTSLVVSPAGGIVKGQTASMTATVTNTEASADAPLSGAPTGTVQFDTGAGLVTATLTPNGPLTSTATAATTALPVGDDTVAANYLGAVNFAASSGSVTGYRVSAVPTTTTISVDSASITYGGAPTISVTVAAADGTTPVGPVDLLDGERLLGTLSLGPNGRSSALLSRLEPGSHQLAAHFVGASSYAGSTSDPLTVTVAKAATTLALSQNFDPAPSKRPVTITVQASPAAGNAAVPSGSLTLSDNGTDIGAGTFDGTGVARIVVGPLAEGAHPITATYAGDGRYLTTSAERDVVANPDVVDHAPDVTATLATTHGSAPFDARISINGSDADGDALHYTVAYSNGAPSDSGTLTGPTNITQRFTDPGNYVIDVNVTDGELTTTKTFSITVIPSSQLVASAGDDQASTEGADVHFDGSGSAPELAIESYHWDFGDGTGADGVTATHHYDHAGTYTASLTITRGTDSASDRSTVTVAAVPATAPTVTVTGGGANLAGAQVTVVLPDGTRQSATTNGAGVATLGGLADGAITIYAWADGFLPGTATLAVLGGAGNASVDLSPGDMGAATLDQHRMTLDEIKAAGIDLADPDNYHVYEANIHLYFEPDEASTPDNTFPVYVTPTGVLCASPDGCWSRPGAGGSGGSTPGCDVTDPQQQCFLLGGYQYFPTVQYVAGEPVIHWLVLPIRTSWLKEFFDVKEIVQNLTPGFTFTHGVANLNLPAGLSLAPTATKQTLTQSVPNIPGGTSATVEWTVRGDVEGYYNLSASYVGSVDPIGVPMQLSAQTKEPLHVWGASALRMKILVDYYARRWAPYGVDVEIDNVSDTDVYNAQVEMLDRPKDASPDTAPFFYAPSPPQVQGTDVIPAGGKFTAHYVLFAGLGNDEVTKLHVVLEKSFVERTGGDVDLAPTLGLRTASNEDSYGFNAGDVTYRIQKDSSGEHDVAHLMWTAPSAPSGLSVTGYQLWTRQSLTGGAWKAFNDPGTDKIHVIPHVSDGQESFDIPATDRSAGRYYGIGTIYSDGSVHFLHTIGTGPSRYVSLGDSFSSGEGVPEFEPGTAADVARVGAGDNNCHRSWLGSYGRLLVSDASISGNLEPATFAACSGAITRDFEKPNQRNAGENPQLDQVNQFTDAISLSAGGNDAGFSDVATACVVADCVAMVDASQAAGSSNWAQTLSQMWDDYGFIESKLFKPATSAAAAIDACANPADMIDKVTCLYKTEKFIQSTSELKNINDLNYVVSPNNVYNGVLKDRLVRIYGELANKAPNARVYIQKYPMEMGPAPDNTVCRVDNDDAFTLTAAEQRKINEFTQAIDNVIEDAKNAANNALKAAGRPEQFVTIDPTDAFAGQQLCLNGVINPNSAFNPLVNPYLPSAYGNLGPLSYSFHPNATGQQNYEKALAAQLNTDLNAHVVTVPQNETADGGSVFVPWGARTLHVDESHHGSTVVISLVSPSGQTFNGGDTGVRYGGDATSSWMELDNPDPGTWHVNLYGADVDPGGETSEINASVTPAAPVGPTAAAVAQPVTGQLATYDFDATSSSGATTYTWTFSDGTTATGPIARHTFAGNGSLWATLEVDTADGHSDWKDVELGPAPTPGLHFVSAPVDTIHTTSASVDYAVDPDGTDAGPSLTCALDDGALPSCPHPLQLDNLSAGSHTVTITATNAIGNVTKISTTWLVDPWTAPQVTAAPHDATAVAGSLATFTVAATGVPTPDIQWQRSSDGGSTWTDIATATAATYAVTSTADMDGQQLRAVVSNGAGSATSKSGHLTVQTKPVLTSPPPVAAIVGDAYTFAVTATGKPAPTFAVAAGQLPPGLSLASTGAITGTPTMPGSYAFTVTASNAAGDAASPSYSLLVSQRPAITSSAPPAATVGWPYAFAVTASGAPTPTFSLAGGSLPPGLSLGADGALNGTPTMAGDYTFSMSATNAVGTATAGPYTVTVSTPPPTTVAPALTSGAPTGAVVGDAYNFLVTATGKPAPTFALTAGQLAPGLSLTNTGAITGTPTTPGSYAFTVTASNTAGDAVSPSYSLLVSQRPAVNSSTPPGGVAGSVYAFTITATGFPAPTFGLASGSLPPGLSLGTDGVLAGTPTTVGDYRFTVAATNAVGSATGGPYTVTVATPPPPPVPTTAPTVTSAAPPNGTVGSAYSFGITSTGSPTPTYAVAAGALPAGLVLSGDGVLTGTPTAAGTSTFTITVSNSAGSVAAGPYTVTIASPPVVVVDKTAPSLTVGKLPWATTAMSVTLGWSAVDAGVGVASYEMRWRSAPYNGGFGGYTYPAALQHTTALSGKLSLSSGAVYCLSVRARDRNGNTTAWSTERCVTRALDDRAMTRSKGWRSGSGSAYYLHTFTYTTTRGATLTLKSARMRHLAILATTCSTCGGVDVLLAGHRIATMSLHAARTHRQVLLVVPVNTYKAGTLVLRSTSTRRVEIDGLAVARV